MNKRVVSIVVGLSSLALAIVLLLIIFLGTNQNSGLPINKTLSATVEDISLDIGESVYNYYSVSDKNANITFDVDKEGIISINKDKIEGKSAGEVNVTINVSNAIHSISKSFVVRVYEKSYKVLLTAVLDCDVDNNYNTLFMKSESCQFRVEVYDRLNNRIEDLSYKILPDKDDVIVEHEFINVVLIATENCRLNFVFEGISFNYQLSVICAN